MKTLTLLDEVRDFAAVASKQVGAVFSEEGEDVDLSTAEYETLAETELLIAWINDMECALTPMFAGWCMSKGIRPDDFDMEDLQDAILLAAGVELEEGGNDGKERLH